MKFFDLELNGLAGGSAKRGGSRDKVHENKVGNKCKLVVWGGGYSPQTCGGNNYNPLVTDDCGASVFIIFE